jgi:hypothetical protein
MEPCAHPTFVLPSWLFGYFKDNPWFDLVLPALRADEGF